MVQFCYLMLYLGVETFSCGLVLVRMAIMDIDWNAMLAKIFKKYYVLCSYMKFVGYLLHISTGVFGGGNRTK